MQVRYFFVLQTHAPLVPERQGLDFKTEIYFVTFFTVSQMSAVAACGKAPQTDFIVDRNIICTGSGSPPIPNGTPCAHPQR